jgi:mRNA-degrading endonuclease toxin of MazEF toxin-antitoxin module
MAVTRIRQARGEVHLVRLDPTVGSEIQKTRPCLVVAVLQRLQEMFAE